MKKVAIWPDGRKNPILSAEMIFKIAQVCIIVFAPYFLSRLTRKWGTENWLSPVVLCYIVGIGLRNLTPFPLVDSISDGFSKGTVLLAIPLLLFSTDLLGWFRLAKTTILSYFFVAISVVISATFFGFLLKDNLPDVGMLSGMLCGVYIGGTPNMNAVGIGLGASEETFVTLNAAEIACGGIYLIVLTSVAHRFFGLFLSDFQGLKLVNEEVESQPKIVWREVLMAIGLTLGIVGLSVGSVLFLFGDLKKSSLIILMISSLGVAASFFQKIRNWQGTFETGDYLLLMFSIAIGMLADFAEIFQNGGWFLLLSAVVMVGSISLHVLFCRLFGIDRDTMMITQVAGFYGPPFIGQIASVIKNRSLVFSGIATGLVGLAVANFIGVAVGEVLRNWF